MNEYGSLMAWCWQDETAYSERENLSHLHFSHNMFHIEWSGLNPRFRGKRLAADCLELLWSSRQSYWKKWCRLRGRPETFGRPEESNNLALLLTMFLKICYLREGRRVFLRARVQIENNSRINSYACRKLSLLAPYFKLCQLCLCVPYRWAPAAATRLVRPFVQPWSSGLWHRGLYMCVPMLRANVLLCRNFPISCEQLVIPHAMFEWDVWHLKIFLLQAVTRSRAPVRCETPRQSSW